MNEGHLGTFGFGGERAATDDHPVILHYLPLAESATSKLDVGVLLKATGVMGATATVGGDNTGVTAASVTAEIFAAKVENAPGSYAFFHDGSDWKLSGETVTIADYGVSLTGSPASGGHGNAWRGGCGLCAPCLHGCGRTLRRGGPAL